jgi:hypothetical protein
MDSPQCDEIDVGDEQKKPRQSPGEAFISNSDQLLFRTVTIGQ